MKKKEMRALTQTALLTAALVLSSLVSIPFAVPFTLQPLALGFCLAAVGAVKTLKILLLYTFLGLVGVPVFSGFRAGFSALAELSGGFIIGFFLMAAAYGVMDKLVPSFKLKTSVVLVFSLLPLHLCGSLWYAFLYLEMSLKGFALSFAAASAPYILPDSAKVIVGGLCAARIKKYLRTV